VINIINGPLERSGVRRREGGLRREGIFRYFLCSIYLSFFVFLLTPTGHTRRPDHDRLWLKTRVSV